MIRPRFRKLLNNAIEADQTLKQAEKFHHFTTPTFAHLLALVLEPPTWFLPSETALLVIDNLQTVFDVAYPRQQQSLYKTRGEAAKWAAGRRYAVLGTLMAALKKVAALHGTAVLVTTGCATRVRQGSGLGAMLGPGIVSQEWDNGIANRICLFRDFASTLSTSSSQHSNKGKQMQSARYAGLQKCNGTLVAEESDVGRIMAFEIDEVGIHCSQCVAYAHSRTDM